MVDEIYDREYQHGRSALNGALLDALTRFSHAVSNAFKVLNRIEYAAPWAVKTRRVQTH